MADDPPQTSSPPVRILLVEDHAPLRRGIRLLIERNAQYRICAEADTINQALEAAAAAPPEVAIVDLSLGSSNGLDLIAALMRRSPTLRILVLSIHSEEMYAERALWAGALGYLMKNEAIEHLLEALACVARGERWLSPAMQRRLRAVERED